MSVQGTLWIAEYSDLANGSIPVVPPIAEQTVDIDTVTANQSAAFQAATNFVELISDSTCTVAWGTDPTATVSNFLLVSNKRKMFRVPNDAGLKLSVLFNYDY